MDFNLTEAQTLLKQTAGQFCRQEIEPIADAIDRDGSLPDALIQKMAAAGFLGMTLPAQFGGGGFSSLDGILAIEEISYSGTGAWWMIAFSNSIPESILRFGTTQQKEKYLPQVSTGASCPSIQFTEADTGSDLDALVTRARREGDGYIVNGMKRFSTFGNRNGFAVLYAKDDDGKCSAFIVDKNSPGYSHGKPFQLMGGGGIETVDVFLDNLPLTKDSLLGKSGDGLAILQHWIADEKIQQCGACLGIAQAAIDEAKQYARSRRVKKKPLAGLLNIRTMLAEMYALLGAARWYTYRTAFLKDQDAHNWTAEAAAAKVFVVPAAMEVIELSRRIHGAYGYTKEFKIERLYRAIAGASVIAVGLELNKAIVASHVMRE